MSFNNIFEKLFEEEEQVLWSQKPKLRKVLDKKWKHEQLLKYFIACMCTNIWILPILIDDTLISLILVSILLLALATPFLILYFSTLKEEYRLLQKTEYFITNKRILAVTECNEKHSSYIMLTNHLVSDVEFYFFNEVLKSNKKTFDLCFMIRPIKEDKFWDLILRCKPINENENREDIKFNISQDKWGEPKSNPHILKVKNLYNKEEIEKILINKLDLTIRNPPLKWRKIGVMNAHSPYGTY